MKTRVSLKYFVSYCLWKLFLILTRPRLLQTLYFLTFLVTLRSFTLFKPEIKAIENSVKDLRVTKNVKEIKFEGVWGELESKKVSRDNNSQNI